MPAMVSRASIIEFARFLGIGGIAALANLCSRYLFNYVMPFEVAVVLAYMVGMLIGYVLFQRMLFGGGDIEARRVMRFIWVNMFGATLAWAGSSIMARQILPALGLTWHPYELAHLCGVAAPAITSFFLHKYYTFAPIAVRATSST